jgi:hypothetical protein
MIIDDTPINETLLHDLAGGEFLAHQRNVVLVGGTGTGKTHLAIAIARSCIRDGKRGRGQNSTPIDTGGERIGAAWAVSDTGATLPRQLSALGEVRTGASAQPAS